MKCTEYTNQTPFLVHLKEVSGTIVPVTSRSTVTADDHFTHIKYVALKHAKFQKLFY